MILWAPRSWENLSSAHQGSLENFLNNPTRWWLPHLKDSSRVNHHSTFHPARVQGLGSKEMYSNVVFSKCLTEDSADFVVDSGVISARILLRRAPDWIPRGSSARGHWTIGLIPRATDYSPICRRNMGPFVGLWFGYILRRHGICEPWCSNVICLINKWYMGIFYNFFSYQREKSSWIWIEMTRKLQKMFFLQNILNKCPPR